jgi:hypothetical protein
LERQKPGPKPKINTNEDQLEIFYLILGQTSPESRNLQIGRT